MSEESKVLSTEEMNALLKVTQEKNCDLTELVGSSANMAAKWESTDTILNNKSLKNITELNWSEVEKILSSFLRKKIVVQSKSAHVTRVTDALTGKTEKHVYSVFKLIPSNYYSLVVLDMPLLHQAINFIFGGQTNDKEPVIETPGKVGIIIAEKIAQLCMEGFSQACKEYGNVNYEAIKTVTLPNLISKFSMEDRVYTMELSVLFGEVETSLSVMVAADFLHDFIPAIIVELGNQDDSWRTTIESQVVDSDVTISVALPEIDMMVNDLVTLKSGDLLPIGDPTSVYISLNDTKLFIGNAGQANSSRVVKILSEI
ncbi:MAG: FliM/FliN family flagellar motor switch protein [Gammaproteobacteria bacterium]